MIPVAVIAGLALVWQQRNSRVSEEPVYQLAILPLAAGSDDPDSLARGLSSLVQLDLDGVPGLQSSPGTRCSACWRGPTGGAAIPPQSIAKPCESCEASGWPRAGWIARGPRCGWRSP